MTQEELDGLFDEMESQINSGATEEELLETLKKIRIGGGNLPKPNPPTQG